MTYKAHIEVVVSLNELLTHNFKKQSNLRFRMSISKKIRQQGQSPTQVQYFEPYAIVRCSQPPIDHTTTFHQRNLSQKSLFPHSFSKKAFFQRNPQPINDYYNKRIYSSQCTNADLRIDNHPYLQPNQITQPPFFMGQQYAKSQSRPFSNKSPSQYESYTDETDYYSRIFEQRRIGTTQLIAQCCHFRGFIKTQELQDSQLLLTVEMMGSNDNSNQAFTIIHKFQATVIKTYGILTYLPIVFDQFQGHMINGVYQAHVLEFIFQSDPKFPTIKSFSHYLQAVTKELKKEDTRYFYQYYHYFMAKQLSSIQHHYMQLLNILKLMVKNPFFQIQPNPIIAQLINNVLEDSFGAIYTKADRLKYSVKETKLIISEQFMREMLQFKEQIYNLMNQCSEVARDNLPLISQSLKPKYDQAVKDRFRHHVFSHTIESNFHYTFSRYEDGGKLLLSNAVVSQFQAQPVELWKEDFPIYNKVFFEDPTHYVKIFEEVFQVEPKIMNQNRKSGIQLSQLNISTVNTSKKRVPSNLQSGIGQHIIIFVHGYQASRQDFMLFKACLQIRYRARVFLSASNEGRTDDTIEAMGRRLASQILTFMKSVEMQSETRISFIGHSMGGIVIRAAIPLLPMLHPHLYTYMSFSSPHLAYLYQPSFLVRAGLWLLSKTSPSQSLKQMTMRDMADLKECSLYKLSQNHALDEFNHLAFISSSQDQYVPYESARVEKNMLLLTGELNHSVKQL